MSTIRLDKYLADAGIGSRSQVKALIKTGRITINGKKAERPEQKIDPEQDQIANYGEIISLSEFEYYLLNKPAGYVTATKDNTAPTVMSLIHENRKDLFPVGRLDKDTEGILLITNNGQLAHTLLSPRKHVEKTYYAITDKKPDEHDIELFATGIEIGDEDLSVALPAKLKLLDSPIEPLPYNLINNEVSIQNPETAFDLSSCKEYGFSLITIYEGKYHQVKRMFQAVGKKVLYLERISFGSLTLPDDLAKGKYIRLSEDDISKHFTDLKC